MFVRFNAVVVGRQVPRYNFNLRHQ
jgi:hypothetical protein